MKSLYIIVVTLFILLISGCNKDILLETPPHLISSELLFKELDGFELGLNGLYDLQRDRWSQYHALDNTLAGVDNMCVNYTGRYFHMDWKGLNNPDDSHLNWTFIWLYETINAANTIINRAGREDVDWTGGAASPEENKNRVIAEAKAIRAWAYRHLTYSWGDVPLALDESLGSTIRTDWTRSPKADVRKQIISDLKSAKQYVPTEGSLQGRLTKGAVQHYLAEMYLAINKPDSALYWADQAINNPAYKLVTERYGVKANEPGVPYFDMFIDGNQNRAEGNTEALWVIQFAANVIGGQGSSYNRIRRTYANRYDVINVGGVRPLQITYERGGRNKQYFGPTKWYFDSFMWPDTRTPTRSDILNWQDDRMSPFAIRWFFILKDADGNAPYPADRLPPGYSYGDTIWLNWDQEIVDDRGVPDFPWSRKADGTDPDNITTSHNPYDQVYLRLADTYLLKAEAQYKLGNPGAAAETINIIRSRSNASGITAADVDIDFILDERSRELHLEEERRFTLLRTGKWFERTQLYDKNGGKNISLRDTLYALPRVVIDANLTSPMPQNPGF